MGIDAHQHFWKYDSAEYAWISDGMEGLKRNFLPADLKPLLDREGFDGCIAVQACHTLDEARWLLGLANQYDFIRGVVGWVDLCSPEVGTQIEALAADSKFVGVRHVVQGEPDERFLLRADFCRGITSLACFDLAYDILVYPRQLPAAIEFVAQFPHQRFVLDHIAKPPITTGELEPWAGLTRELARQPNVCCKLSGMVTEAKWKQWTAEDFRPYLDVVLEAFGPERLMIGSDWPVCTLSADYASTMRIVKDFIAQLSHAEKDAILGGNCARFYRLER
jgi:L-fuconolactonase